MSSANIDNAVSSANAENSEGIMSADDATTPEPPFLRVVSGNPTDEDIATLVVLFSGLRSAPESTTSAVRSAWGLPTDQHRPSRLVSPAAESLRRSW